MKIAKFNDDKVLALGAVIENLSGMPGWQARQYAVIRYIVGPIAFRNRFMVEPKLFTPEQLDQIDAAYTLLFT